jgi:hypothetical protein
VRTIVSAAAAAFLLALPFAGVAEEHKGSHASIEELLVQFADKPEEHAALADYYRAKAAASREDAAAHRTMAKQYAAGKLLQKDAMRAHCEALAKQADAMAAEYERLAGEHDKAAKP